MGRKPRLREPGASALNNLLVAVDRVNVAAQAGGNVDEHFMDLTISAAQAADNFAAKEADATNIRLVTKSGRIYTRGGQIQTRETLTVEFDYHAGTQTTHYALS